MAKYIFTLALIYLLSIHYGYCQDTQSAQQSVLIKLESVALLKIATGDVSLYIIGATIAGAPITTATENEDTRLRITSLANEGVNRIITAKISKELIGTDLLVEVKPPTTANFSGNGGTFTEPIILSTTDQKIVNAVGTCWSGTSIDDGYVLKYIYKLSNKPVPEGQNVEESTSVVVTYTLSDEA